MTDHRALDALVAEKVMGWTKVRCNDAAWYGKPPEQQWTTIDIPSYSSDIASAYLMEVELERRGLRDAYMRALIELTSKRSAAIFNSAIECDWYDDDMNGWAVAWGLAHATPEDRCRAALKALENTND